MTGTIKRLVRDKGFGFILSHDNQIEYFFHRSTLMNENFDVLQEGAKVTFEEAQSIKGPRAENVIVQ